MTHTGASAAVPDVVLAGCAVTPGRRSGQDPLHHSPGLVGHGLKGAGTASLKPEPRQELKRLQPWADKARRQGSATPARAQRCVRVATVFPARRHHLLSLTHSLLTQWHRKQVLVNLKTEKEKGGRLSLEEQGAQQRGEQRPESGAAWRGPWAPFSTIPPRVSIVTHSPRVHTIAPFSQFLRRVLNDLPSVTLRLVFAMKISRNGQK